MVNVRRHVRRRKRRKMHQYEVQVSVPLPPKYRSREGRVEHFFANVDAPTRFEAERKAKRLVKGATAAKVTLSRIGEE